MQVIWSESPATFSNTEARKIQMYRYCMNIMALIILTLLILLGILMALHIWSRDSCIFNGQKDNFQLNCYN